MLGFIKRSWVWLVGILMIAGFFVYAFVPQDQVSPFYVKYCKVRPGMTAAQMKAIWVRRPAEFVRPALWATWRIGGTMETNTSKSPAISKALCTREHSHRSPKGRIYTQQSTGLYHLSVADGYIVHAESEGTA